MTRTKSDIKSHSSQSKHSSEDAIDHSESSFINPGPNPVQQAWMNYKLGIRFTFGVNSYYNTEKSDGSLDPSVIALEKIDTDEWVDLALNAGMKYCLFTTKHYDGFCNWNTSQSYYNILNTPFNKDLLGMLSNSCYRKGMKLGLYFSLWDSYVSFFDIDQKYFEYMMRQLEELFTGYGEVAELWLDGFWLKQTGGWDLLPQDFISAWRMEGAYRYRIDYMYRKIKEWHPACIILNHSSRAFLGLPLHPVDARTGVDVINLVVDTKYWEWLGKQIYLPLEVVMNLSGKENGRFEPGFWFFHDGDNTTPPYSKVVEWQQFADRHNANLVLNVPITPEGKFRQVDEKLFQVMADPGSLEENTSE